jgi:hypothetical protein
VLKFRLLVVGRSRLTDVMGSRRRQGPLLRT